MTQYTGRRFQGRIIVDKRIVVVYRLTHPIGSTEDCVEYDAQSWRVFFTRMCSECKARSSVQPSSSGQESAVSARSSDELFEVLDTRTTSNILIRASASLLLVASEFEEDQFVTALPVIC